MQRIMILGAGPAQVPLIRAARAMGLYTIAATIPGNYPGIPEADEVTYTDIADPPAIAAAAQALAVDGVATCCFEVGMRALGYTCEKLGLHGIGRRAAEISVNKRAMKEAFAAGAVQAPDWRLLRTGADLDAAIDAFGLPMVVKAADLQGSNGVYVLHDRAAAHEALAKCLALTGEDYCLAEQFVAGESFCAEAFVQNGRILFVLPDGNLTVSNPDRPNIPIGHYAPLDCSDAVRARITDQAERAIRACGFDDCAVNFDFVLQDGEPYIIELTARAGATCLSELIGAHFGVDYYQMILMAALGRDARALFDRRRAQPLPVAASMLRAPAAGTVRAIHLPDPLPGYVRELTVLVRPGDAVRPFENAGDRIGQVLVSGDDVPQCLARLEAVLNEIVIEVQ